jgi:hypothetical protein
LRAKDSKEALKFKGNQRFLNIFKENQESFWIKNKKLR